MALTAEQREQVEQNLHLVSKTISRFITTHNDIPGMEYDDLYQIGCLALCKAAQSYRASGKASFATYAGVVIRNRLYDHCRHVNHLQSHILYLDSSLKEDEPGCFLDYAVSEHPANRTDSLLFSLLLTKKEEYGGIAAKGIDALLLKANGFSGKEIAKMYRVKPNHVSAWISRANSRLRREPFILEAIEP